MPDPAGGENPAAAGHHVMTGQCGRLVDDDESWTGGGFAHSTMAVSTSPRSTDHRPVSSVSGGPDSAGGSIRIRGTKLPPRLTLSTAKRMWAASKPRHLFVSGNSALSVVSFA